MASSFINMNYINMNPPTILLNPKLRAFALNLITKKIPAIIFFVWSKYFLLFLLYILTCSSGFFYPVAENIGIFTLIIWRKILPINLALKPVFLPLLLEWNLIVISFFFDFKDLKFDGIEDPQSQVLVYLAMFPTNR